MKKATKLTIDDVLDSMREIDLGSCYVGRFGFKKHKEIILDNDPDGNARFGYLVVKVTDNGIKINGGRELRKSERGRFWPLGRFPSVDDMVDNFGIFSRKYFNSFIVVRKK